MLDSQRKEWTLALGSLALVFSGLDDGGQGNGGNSTAASDRIFRNILLGDSALTPNFRPRSGKLKVESAPFFSCLGGQQGRRFPLPSRSAARPRRGGPKGRGRSGATAASVIICRSLLTGILRPASSCPAPSASFRCCSIRSTASVHGTKNVRRRRPWDRHPRTSPSTTGVR